MVPHAPPIVASPPIFRPDWETLVILASTPSKLLDLNACPAPTSLRQFCGATDKPKPAWFWGQTKKPSWWFWGPNHQTRAAGFEAQTRKPSTTLVLRLNQKTDHLFWGQTGRNRHHQFWGQTRENRRHWFWGQTSENRPSDFEAKPLTNHRPWFWGSTKKPAILVSTC
jgi:hypothetical protein